VSFGQEHQMQLRKIQTQIPFFQILVQTALVHTGNDGGTYQNTSPTPFTIDNGAFLATNGGTVELPVAGTVFESGSW